MELTAKKRILIAQLYGIIVAISNAIGVIMPLPSSLEALNMQDYTRLLETYKAYFTLFQTITFVIPAILCLIYILKSSGENFYNRFINMPVAFSLLGTTGWVFFTIVKVVALLFVKHNTHIPITPILFTLGMRALLMGLLSFTISYFTLETLHRKIFLPMFFPEGHISKYKNISNPSLKFLFFVFYISAGILPMLYILSAFYADQINKGIKPDVPTLVMITSMLRLKNCIRVLKK